MADDTRITRTVEIDLPADELWALVAGDEGWSTWLVDDADVAVEPGATGMVIDDGESLHVRVDEVEPHDRVRFTWWPEDRPEVATTVTLVVLPGRLLITETFRSASTASAAVRWDVRALVLGSLGLLARV